MRFSPDEHNSWENKVKEYFGEILNTNIFKSENEQTLSKLSVFRLGVLKLTKNHNFQYFSKITS